MKLTNKAVKAFTYAGGWDVRWDDTVTGLGLRVYPSGRKGFVLSYRCHGRKRLLALGKFGTMTVEQAREEAKDKLELVRKEIDPLEEKRKAARAKTFGELIESYLVKHAKGPRFPSKPRKKTWRDDERRLKHHIPASWRSRRIVAITRSDIQALHDKVGANHPYEANRLLALLRVVFRFAHEDKHIEQGIPNPAVGITKFKETKRKRFVQPSEMPALARAIDGEANVYIRAALWLYLLTGLRKSELLRARWEDVNWDEARLRLPDTKAGEEQTVPLSTTALAILQAIPRLEGNPHIIVGRRKGRPLRNIGGAWERIRDNATVNLWSGYDHDPRVPALVASLRERLKTAGDNREPTAMECREAADFDLPKGFEDVRLHDLRRTAGSWMSAAGTDLNRVKDALRHADIATTLTYARLSEDAAREPIEELGKMVMAAARPAGPVVLEGGKR